MQINSTSSGTSSIFNMDETGSRLSASIISEKDTDASGDVSAAELGVSSSELAEFDSDGDGVLSSAELAVALKSRREKMQAQMSSQMEQSGQLGMLQSTLNGSSAQGSGSAEEPSLDSLIAGLFGDGQTAAVSAGGQSQSASNAGGSLPDYQEQMDAQMAENLMSIKDSDGDGQLSAEELGATAEQLARLDADGDGLLSEAELAGGLRAERETMMAQNGGVMPPPPGEQAATVGESGAGRASGMDSASMDALMQSMFSSRSSSDTSSVAGSTSATASMLSEYLLRQKASSAYQSVDNLIAGLFGGGASTQSVSLEA